MLLLPSALKQLLSEDLLDKFLTEFLLTVAYPGLSLGILFFAKRKLEAFWGLRDWVTGTRPLGKSFITHSESLLNTLEFSLG